MALTFGFEAVEGLTHWMCLPVILRGNLETASRIIFKLFEGAFLWPVCVVQHIAAFLSQSQESV